MRLRAFELTEPVPELNEPHALAILRPWIDVGNVGTLTLSRLESHLHTVELAKLARPGSYLDFTRYRPTISLREGERKVNVPNTTISYAKQEGGHDFLLLRLLEPHMLAETYVDSVLDILKRFGVKRYWLIGSMYDMIPYTRPLLISGIASNIVLQQELIAAKVRSSSYEGPTTIAFLVSQRAPQFGIETATLIVHLPGYLTLEDDYRGEVRLMEALSYFYGFPISQIDREKAEEQQQQVRRLAEQMIWEDPRLKLVLNQLEDNYDSRLVEGGMEEIQLSPEVEKFLQDLDKRFKQD